MPEWVRVRDLSTGHEYDLQRGQLPVYAGGVELVAGYPIHVAANPRRPKHHIDKAGRPATPRRARKNPPEVSGEPTPTNTTEEQL